MPQKVGNEKWKNVCHSALFARRLGKAKSFVCLCCVCVCRCAYDQSQNRSGKYANVLRNAFDGISADDKCDCTRFSWKLKEKT